MLGHQRFLQATNLQLVFCPAGQCQNGHHRQSIARQNFGPRVFVECLATTRNCFFTAIMRKIADPIDYDWYFVACIMDHCSRSSICMNFFQQINRSGFYPREACPKIPVPVELFKPLIENFFRLRHRHAISVLVKWSDGKPTTASAAFKNSNLQFQRDAHPKVLQLASFLAHNRVFDKYPQAQRSKFCDSIMLLCVRQGCRAFDSRWQSFFSSHEMSTVDKLPARCEPFGSTFSLPLRSHSRARGRSW